MRPFTQVDVFTDQLTLGNAVAVVHDAGDLSGETMAALARWTQLAETTFLLPPTDPSADYRLRIFTPSRELPFAGHPTLGSARAWLAVGGTPRSGGDEIVQECEAGLVRLRGATGTGDDGGRLAFAAPPPRRGGPVDADDVATLARGLRVAPGDVVDARWVDNGPGWVAVLLRDAAAVLAVEPDPASFGALEAVGVVGPHTAGDADVEVRAFTLFDGQLVEDPVTGSLNAGLGQWLTGAGHAPARYVAAQGTRLRRRGRVHVEREGDEVWVGGDTVLGVRGTIAI